jgi:hypothetical protein
MSKEEDIFEHVHVLMLAEIMREREALKEALESDDGIYGFTPEEENMALRYLLECDSSIVAEAYIDLMKIFIESEVREDMKGTDDA